MEFRLRRVTSPAPSLLKRISRLRAAAWEDDSSHDLALRGWIDAHDAHATHWLAFHGDGLAAGARVCMHEEIEMLPDADLFARAPRVDTKGLFASFGRVVVAPGFKENGLAQQLHEKLLLEAEAHDCLAAVCAVSPELGRKLVEMDGERIHLHDVETRGSSLPGAVILQRPTVALMIRPLPRKREPRAAPTVP
jgi:GNAT superfamily N-acetyltransferase